MNLLITSGGTQEKIDQVRSITNTSTGATALAIAQTLYRNGKNNIYFLHAKKASSFRDAKENISFESSEDLEKSLKEVLQNTPIDIIIHAAAVSDFTVDKVVINGELFESAEVKKISSLDNVELILKSRPKIIAKLRGFATKSTPLIVGFKLTNTADKDEQLDQVLNLSMSDSVDFVVHNDLSNITEDAHRSKIYFKDQVISSGTTKKDLADNILELINTYSFNLASFKSGIAIDEENDANGSKYDSMS